MILREKTERKFGGGGGGGGKGDVSVGPTQSLILWQSGLLAPSPMWLERAAIYSPTSIPDPKMA